MREKISGREMKALAGGVSTVRCEHTERSVTRIQDCDETRAGI